MNENPTHLPMQTDDQKQTTTQRAGVIPLAWADVLAVLVILAIFLFCSQQRIWQSDVWGHLKYGQWIVQNRALPETALFSPYVDKDANYAHFYTVSQTSSYLLFRLGEALAGGDEMHRLAGGVMMLQALHGLLMALRFGALLIAFRRWTGSTMFGIVGIGLIWIFSQDALGVQRPQKWGELFFAMLMVPLCRPVLSRRALFLIPLMFVIWANSHGSFMVGLVLIGVFLCGRMIEVGRENQSWNPKLILNDRRILRLLVVLFASILVICLANPHGPFIFLHVLRLARHPNISFMSEWMPIYITLTGNNIRYVIILGMIFASQALVLRWRTPVMGLLFVVFSIPPVIQIRMMAWWWMVMPLVLLPLWVDLWALVPFRWNFIEGQRRYWKSWIAVALIVASLAAWNPIRLLISRQPAPLSDTLSQATPYRLAWQLEHSESSAEFGMPKLKKELDKHYRNGEFRGTIFAEANLADFLVWRLPPEKPLMTFSHVHTFSGPLYREYISILFGNEKWDDVLRKYRINLVVVAAELRPVLADKLRDSDEWVVILDEASSTAKDSSRERLFIALRKKPL